VLTQHLQPGVTRPIFHMGLYTILSEYLIVTIPINTEYGYPTLAYLAWK